MGLNHQSLKKGDRGEAITPAFPVRCLCSARSHKPLKPLLRRLTNRAYPRRLLPCAEIPADFAAPDRQGEDRAFGR